MRVAFLVYNNLVNLTFLKYSFMRLLDFRIIYVEIGKKMAYNMIHRKTIQ